MAEEPRTPGHKGVGSFSATLGSQAFGDTADLSALGGFGGTQTLQREVSTPHGMHGGGANDAASEKGDHKSEPDTALGTTAVPTHRLKEKEAGLLYAVEAQWILSVLGDCSDKLFLASFLTPDILQDPILNSTKDRNPIIVHLDAFFEAQDSYLQLLDAREAANAATAAAASAAASASATATATGGMAATMAGPAGVWTDAHRKELEKADEILTDTTRVAMRLLKSNPTLINRLRELASSQRPASVLEFINTFYRLRNLFAAKLRQTQEKENDDEQQLAALNAQNEADAARLALKQKKLSDQAAAHARAVTEKNEKIERVRLEYEREKAKMEDRRAKLLAEMGDDAKKRERDYGSREAERLRTVSDEQTGLDNAISVNFSAEMKNHERRYHHTLAVRDKIAKYDDDLQRKHDELLKQRAEYAAEQAEMARLQAHFDAVDAEEAAIAAEQAAVRLRRDKQMEVDRRRHHAATLMQKLFRGYYIREKEKARRAKIRAKLEAKLKRDVFGNILPGQTIGKKKKKK